MKKDNSTNTTNKMQLEDDCGMAYTISAISGRWKMSILGFLLEDKLRFSDLKRKMPNITERMLIKQLKELQIDGIVNRISYPEVPPKVEYELTDKGKSLEKIILLMSQWGENNKPNKK